MRTALILTFIAAALLASLRGPGFMMGTMDGMTDSHCLSSVCMTDGGGMMTLDCLNHCLSQGTKQSEGIPGPAFALVSVAILLFAVYAGAAPIVRAVANLGFDWIRKKDIQLRITSVVLLD